VVLENLDLENHRTRELVQRLGGLGIDGKTLLVDSLENHNLSLASRNVPGLKTVDALAVNVYDVVDRPFLVLSEGALNRLVEVLAK
jgi:large subunit ribosomal protein L4